MIKWLLRNNPALLGDIVEERACGRSAAWYCRQVVFAVARSVGNSVREHPLLMLRAIATAIAGYILMAIILAVAEGYFYGRYLDFTKVDPRSAFIVTPMAVLPALFSGWILARTHRPCVEAATLVMILVVWAATLNPMNDWFRPVETASLLAGAFLGLRQHAAQVAQASACE
jgi:hypothetical protein